MNKQIVISNLLISYTEQTGDSRKALLFLHGWRSNKEVWNDILLRISAEGGSASGGKDKGLRMITLDLPGFGKSQNPLPNPPHKGEGNDRGWTVGDYANVVAEFIKKLELKNVILVGHSFGGRVGIKLLSEHPELISKLVLVDSAGFPMSAGKKSLIKTMAKIARPFFKPAFMQGFRKKIYKQIGAEDYLATPELQQTFINVTSEDLSEDMKKIKVPTLIVNGENDKVTPVEYGKLMKYLIPNSKFQILSGAGHFSFLDKPEEFVEILKGFIS